jgi:dTDP-4-dehydrorhamnose reductase
MAASLKPITTLVIGTTGQLATELRRRAEPGLELTPPERVDLSNPADLEASLERLRPQLVVNAGAYTAVDRAESEPQQAHAVNAAGPGVLARWCERNEAALIHVSTDYVFDGSKLGPYVESDTTAPINVYGQSKLAGELAIRSALERHIILRTSWVFSAHGHNFVKTMLRLAKERDKLRVVADQKGRPTAAAELARVICLLGGRFAAASTLSWGTYHFASAGATTWEGLAQATVALQAHYSGRRPSVGAILSTDYPTPAQRPLNSVLDTRLFEQTFGVEPRPWLDDLRSVVDELSGAASAAHAMAR